MNSKLKKYTWKLIISYIAIVVFAIWLIIELLFIIFGSPFCFIPLFGLIGSGIYFTIVMFNKVRSNLNEKTH